MTDDLLHDLNVAQRDAVVHRGSPLLVVAGPGSGKTRVVTRRIAYRVLREHVDPRRVIAITFTARAASEMRERVQALVGDADVPRVGTFHWFCHGILRRHLHLSGRSRNFHLLPPHDARTVLAEAARLAARGAFPVRGLAASVSAVKNGVALEIASAQQRVDSHVMAAVLREYQNRLRTLNALDLDDLLTETVSLFQNHDGLRERMRHAIVELLVDEYQDTNPIQHDLLNALQPASGNLVVVGDEDQAIYGWRNASGQPFHGFVDAHEGGTIILLEDTYRSSKHVLRAAGALITHNSDRLEKGFRTTELAGALPVCLAAEDENDEAKWIAQEIERLVEAGTTVPKDVAILFRVNAQGRALEDALMAAGIAYTVVGGRKFFEHPEVRSAVAALRLITSPTDSLAADHLVGQIRGIGKSRLELLRHSYADRSLHAALSDPASMQGLPESITTVCRDLADRLKEGEEFRARPVKDALDWSIEIARFVHLGTSPDLDAEVLEEFRSTALETMSARATVADLVEHLHWDQSVQNEDAGVRLMSLHAAKGLEFDVVFITGLEEGLLPHHRALAKQADIEEERRLCYVGMTRTRQVLYMTYTHARMLGGRALYGAPSRFIAEMGQANVRRQSTGTASKRPRLARVDVGDRVRHARWHDGTVVAVEGTGRDTLVTVLFQDVGRRRLQLYHAPLQRLP